MDETARPLIVLTQSFLAGEMDASTFDEGFREIFSRMPHLEEETFFALENLAVACSDYIEEPEFRLEETDLDEEGLRAAATHALTRLGLA